MSHHDLHPIFQNILAAQQSVRTERLLTAAELRNLVDEIERSDGLLRMTPEGPIQLGIKRSAAIIAALRQVAHADETRKEPS